MLLLVGIMNPTTVQAHGSVTAEDDLCLIEIGYFTAHFKIFLPSSHRHQEFCEDLPRGGEAVFVMDYIHGDLASVAIDFRIIRNVTGLGRFATLEDVNKIADLESVTVFYQAPRVESDVLTVLHDFSQTGEYLGIVTAKHPQTQQIYSAVFPFEVGYFRLGFLPLFALLAIGGQLCYWLMRPGNLPWRERNAPGGSNGEN